MLKSETHVCCEVVKLCPSTGHKTQQVLTQYLVRKQMDKNFPPESLLGT